MVTMYTIFVDSYGEKGYLSDEVNLTGDVEISFVSVNDYDSRDIYACFTKGKAREVLERVKNIVHSMHGCESGVFKVESISLTPDEVKLIAKKQFNV